MRSTGDKKGEGEGEGKKEVKKGEEREVAFAIRKFSNTKPSEFFTCTLLLIHSLS